MRMTAGRLNGRTMETTQVGISAARASASSRLAGWHAKPARHPCSRSHRISVRILSSCPPKPSDASVCRIMRVITAGWAAVYTGAIVASPRMTVAAPPIASAERKPLTVIFRVLERDERVFAVLLAVGMVAGLATLGLFPAATALPRSTSIGSCSGSRRTSSASLPLSPCNPRAHAPDLPGRPRHRSVSGLRAPVPDRRWESLFYLLFFPLVAVNAYYFGPVVGLGAALAAGGLYAAAASLVPPWAGWTAVVIVSVLAGLPAVTLGLVAERERRARGEVERLNDRVQGHAHPAGDGPGRAARGRAHGDRRASVAQGGARGAQPHQRHRVERGDAPGHREAAGDGSEGEEAAHLVEAILDQVGTLDALTEEYLQFARFPKPHFEEESLNHLVSELAEFIRPWPRARA